MKTVNHIRRGKRGSALVEYGLIVAIPCLLMHAFLSAQARGIVGRMEATGLSFMNTLIKREQAQPGT